MGLGGVVRVAQLGGARGGDAGGLAVAEVEASASCGGVVVVGAELEGFVAGDEAAGLGVGGEVVFVVFEEAAVGDEGVGECDEGCGAGGGGRG